MQSENAVASPPVNPPPHVDLTGWYRSLLEAFGAVFVAVSSAWITYRNNRIAAMESREQSKENALESRVDDIVETLNKEREKLATEFDGKMNGLRFEMESESRLLRQDLQKATALAERYQRVILSNQVKYQRRVEALQEKHRLELETTRFDMQTAHRLELEGMHQRYERQYLELSEKYEALNSKVDVNRAAILASPGDGL